MNILFLFFNLKHILPIILPYRTNALQSSNIFSLLEKLICTINGCQYKIHVPLDKILAFKKKTHPIRIQNFLAEAEIKCDRCNFILKEISDSYFEFEKKLSFSQLNKIKQIGKKEYERIFGRAAN